MYIYTNFLLKNYKILYKKLQIMTSMLNLYKNSQNFQIQTKILTLSKIPYTRKCGNNSNPMSKLELFFSMKRGKRKQYRIIVFRKEDEKIFIPLFAYQLFLHKTLQRSHNLIMKMAILYLLFFVYQFPQ